MSEQLFTSSVLPPDVLPSNYYGFLYLGNYDDYKKRILETIEYIYPFFELTQDDIYKLYKINNTLLEYKHKLLNFLFNQGFIINDYIFGNSEFRFCIKNSKQIDIGTWDFRKTSPSYYIIGSDITSLVACYYNFSYIEAINIIYNHIIITPLCTLM